MKEDLLRSSLLSVWLFPVISAHTDWFGVHFPGGLELASYFLDAWVDWFRIILCPGAVSHEKQHLATVFCQILSFFRSLFSNSAT